MYSVVIIVAITTANQYNIDEAVINRFWTIEIIFHVFYASHYIYITMNNQYTIADK